jgi:hypothetical protein
MIFLHHTECQAKLCHVDYSTKVTYFTHYWWVPKKRPNSTFNGKTHSQPAFLCIAGGCSTVAMILPMEYFGPRYRIITSNRLGWQIGGIILALLGYLIRKW